MKAIADTGFLVAFSNRTDRHHEWALQLASRIREPLLTCESVLAETTFHTNASIALDLLDRGLVRVTFDLQAEMPHLLRFAVRYADRRPDLADLCLIRMSELYPRHSIITVDVSDFRIYRRNQREAIPLLHPPGL